MSASSCHRGAGATAGPGSIPVPHIAPEYPKLSESNSTSLQKLYVANKVELTKHISAAAGACEHLFGGDDWYVRFYEAPTSVQGVRTGHSNDAHNLIEHQDLPTRVIHHAVTTVHAHFAKQRRCFSWVVGPMDQPQLEVTLRNRSFGVEENQPVMVLDLPSQNISSPNAWSSHCVSTSNQSASPANQPPRYERPVKPVAQVQRNPIDLAIHHEYDTEFKRRKAEAMKYLCPPPKVSSASLVEQKNKILKRTGANCLEMARQQLDTPRGNTRSIEPPRTLPLASSALPTPTPTPTSTKWHEGPPVMKFPAQEHGLGRSSATTASEHLAELRRDIELHKKAAAVEKMRYAGNSKDVPTSSSTLPIRQAPARSTADGNANETLDSEHEALNSYFEWETRMLADEDRDYERLRDRVAARMNLTEELQRSDKILQCLDDNILKLMRSEVRVPQVSPTPARHSNAVADDATPQITVFTVDNRHAIASWAQAWAYEAPTSGTDVRHWTSIYRSLVSTLPSSQFIMFAAKAPGDYNGFSDNIVGTGYLHMYAGVAAMHSIVVRPQYRHRGIGARLVEHGMQLAKQKGYNMVMLTATRSGLPLFRKAGFKEFGRCKQYVWRPLKENYGPAPQRPAQWKQPEVKVEMNAEAGPKQDSNKTEDAGTHTAVDEQPGGCETSHDPVNESDVEFICYDSDSEDWEVLHT